MAKISISLPDDVLAGVDEAAELDGRSRSQWITRAVQRVLGHTRRLAPPTEAQIQKMSSDSPWSPCSAQCDHPGPRRVLTTDGWSDLPDEADWRELADAAPGTVQGRHDA